MPDLWERHSKDRWEWGKPAPRSQTRAAAAEDQVADPQPEKVKGKNRDPDWCKGRHPHGPHEAEYVYRPWFTKASHCDYRVTWARDLRKDRVRFVCWHVRICKHCRKEMGGLEPERCPWYPGTAEGRKKAEAQLAERERKQALWEEKYLKTKPSRSRKRVLQRTAYRKPKIPKMPET